MKKILMVIAAAMTLVLAGCGGGGGSSGSSVTSVPNDAAAGYWLGTNNEGRQVNTITLRDGQTYAFYEAVGAPTVFAGLVQANGVVGGTTTTATITSGDARVFALQNPSTVYAASISASTSLNGTITASVSSSSPFTTMTGVYSDPAFRTTAANLTRTFNGAVGVPTGTETATVVVNNNAITGNSVSGCTYTGTLTPITNFRAYTLSITLGNVAACNTLGSLGATYTGLAYVEPGGAGRLFAAALNANRTGGFIFQGQ